MTRGRNRAILHEIQFYNFARPGTPALGFPFRIKAMAKKTKRKGGRGC